MENQRPDNIPDAPLSSAAPSEIPSVVASSKRKNTLAIAGFLALMGLLMIAVLRGGHRKAAGNAGDPTVNDATYVQPTSGADAVPAPRPKAIPVTFVPPRSARRGGANALIEMRRKSPMVIFNKQNQGTAGTGPATPGGAGGSTSNRTASGFGMDAGGNSVTSSVPLPQNFTPTNAASAHATQLGNQEFMLAQGKVIDAVLETAINSDHPGMLRALVSADIYGDHGTNVLVPRGSRLIGQYDAGVVKGQNRVFVFWSRAIRPDGIDIQLDSAGTDPLGRTGIEGDVDNHFWTMFGAASLLSIIGAGAATVGVHSEDNANSVAAYRAGVAQSFGSASNTVLGEFVRIKPTITVDQGVKIKVFVSRDLYFDALAAGLNQVQVIQ